MKSVDVSEEAEVEKVGGVAVVFLLRITMHQCIGQSLMRKTPGEDTCMFENTSYC